MPLKNGELNASELRRLIKKHNQLMSIKIPPKTNRDGLIKLIESNGYKINHAGQKLEPSVQMKRKPVVKLPPAPAKKTSEEKAEAKKKKQSKAEKQEEEAFESRKKKIEAIKKIRKNKTQPKKDIKDNLINTNIEKKTMTKKKPVEKEVFSSIKSPTDITNSAKIKEALKKYIGEKNTLKLTKDMNTNKALLFIFEKKEGISIPEIKKRYDSLPKNVKDNFALRFYGLNNETYNP